MKLPGDLKATSIKYISSGIAALGALALAAQANAADIYAPAPGGFKDIPPVIAPLAPTWTGFYAGINMGAAWTNLDLHDNYYGNPSTPIVCSAGVAYCFGGGHLDSQNAFGGGQLGYNWQGWGSWVLGVEVDLLGVGGNNGRTFIGSTDGTTIVGNVRQEGGFAGDVTGRLGYAWGNWLLYAKGGWAWFNPELSASAVAYSKNAIGAFNGWDNSTSLSGWTVGGGLEWLLNPNWSVKLEYMYYEYGLNNSNWNASYSGVVYNNWRLFDNDLTVNTVKLGVNYHLSNNAYVPLK